MSIFSKESRKLALKRRIERESVKAPAGIFLDGYLELNLKKRKVFVNQYISQELSTQELIEKCTYDNFLKGVYNREQFDEELKKLLSLYKRHYSEEESEEFGLILIDIDYFKDINDTYGHPCGDEALKGIVATLKKTTREEDRIGRVGGEEFGILLPKTDIRGSLDVAERVRKTVESTIYDCNGQNVKMTVSLGVGVPIDNNEFPDTFYSKVDRALYLAKTSGRNQTSITNDWLMRNFSNNL